MFKQTSTQPLTPSALTRRDVARWALAGAAGALLTPVLASAQVVDPGPDSPPVLPLPAAPPPGGTPPRTPEGDLLTQLVPVNVGHALSSTQAKEVALQLKDYPGGFAKARAFALPDDVGPAFAADAPTRKERRK
jgi:hypothetical protein